MRSLKILTIFFALVTVLGIAVGAYAAATSNVFSAPQDAVEQLPGTDSNTNNDNLGNDGNDNNTNGDNTDNANSDQQLTQDQYKIELENLYKHSIYELCNGMNNLSATLSKLTISNDRGYESKLLRQCATYLAVCSVDLSILPVAEDDDTVAQATKFINQASDYISSLSCTLSEGGSLNSTHRSGLASLQGVADRFYTKLKELAKSGEYVIKGNPDTTAGDESEEQRQDTLFNYPTLIYDGPYSDSLKMTKIKSEEDIGEQAGADAIKNAFTAYEFVSVTSVATIDNDKIKARVYECTDKEGNIFTIIATLDGRIAQMNGNISSTATEQEFKAEEYMDIAEQMCRTLGFDVSPMWLSQEVEGRVYVNLCYVQDDVTVYPDMVKVCIDATTKKVVGIESFAYLANHKMRKLPNRFNDYSRAASKLSGELVVDRAGKAIIPDECGEEHACYEFVCMYDGDAYYVYIDAKTHQERKILKVINTTEGYYTM